MNNVEQLVVALRSGQYEQAYGQLFDGKGYCCLGVAEHAVLGIEFVQADNGKWVDPRGAFNILDDVIAAKFGFNKKAARDDWGKLVTSGLTGPGEEMCEIGQRQNVLASLNDGMATFEAIADAIELLGWDKE